MKIKEDVQIYVYIVSIMAFSRTIDTDEKPTVTPSPECRRISSVGHVRGELTLPSFILLRLVPLYTFGVRAIIVDVSLVYSCVLSCLFLLFVW